MIIGPQIFHWAHSFDIITQQNTIEAVQVQTEKIQSHSFSRLSGIKTKI